MPVKDRRPPHTIEVRTVWTIIEYNGCTYRINDETGDVWFLAIDKWCPITDAPATTTRKPDDCCQKAVAAAFEHARMNACAVCGGRVSVTTMTRCAECWQKYAHMWPEVCICAAIRLKSGRVIRGHRHHHCLAAAREESPGQHRLELLHAEQGFITSHNRFVGREEGRRIQEAVGITSVAPDGYRGALLYSEDLY